LTRRAAPLALLLVAACSSNQADVSEQLKRIQEQELADAKARAQGNADPLTSSAKERLEVDVHVLEQRLAEAEQGASPSAVAAASTALDQAKRRLAAEVERERQLEELRARTPKRLIKIEGGKLDGSGPASRSAAAASAPASRPASGGWFGADSMPASIPSSSPASSPASAPRTATRPAPPADELAEFQRLDERIRYLADLRTSAGDRAGGSRVKRELLKWTQEFKTGDRVKALEALRKLETEAHR
jgi:hypothetical protein